MPGGRWVGPVPGKAAEKCAEPWMHLPTGLAVPGRGGRVAEAGGWGCEKPARSGIRLRERGQESLGKSYNELEALRRESWTSHQVTAVEAA